LPISDGIAPFVVFPNFQLYCDKDLEKDTRNIFLTGTVKEIREDFQNTMSYCARDVGATHDILGKLMPAFYER
jgi:DNA polymerase gamma 1